MPNKALQRTQKAHANFWLLAALLALFGPLNLVVAMMCIANDCAKSTYKTTFHQLLAQSLSKSSDFLICAQCKS